MLCCGLFSACQHKNRPYCYSPLFHAALQSYRPPVEKTTLSWHICGTSVEPHANWGHHFISRRSHTNNLWHHLGKRKTWGKLRWDIVSIVSLSNWDTQTIKRYSATACRKKWKKPRLPGLVLQIILLHCHPLPQDPTLPGLYPLREQHCSTSSHNHRQSMWPKQWSVGHIPVDRLDISSNVWYFVWKFIKWPKKP